MNKDVLTTKEIKEATDLFFKSFNIIDKAMPEGSSIEDTQSSATMSSSSQPSSGLTARKPSVMPALDSTKLKI